MNQDMNTAHFDQVKSQNMKLIRNILRKESTMGISQLSKVSGLSYPTVASLLKQLQKSGQVRLSDKTEINGGRPGVRYEFCSSYQYAFGVIVWGKDVQINIYNAAGVREQTVDRHYTNLIQVSDICNLVSEFQQKYRPISAIALGIPGTAYHEKITHLPLAPDLIGSDLATQLKEEFHADLYIENDINAISFDEIGKMKNFAHVVFMDRCIGVGIVLDGEVVKGMRGFAGEFQYLVSNDKDTAQVLAECILILISVLDLEDFIISSDSATPDTSERVMMILKKILPEARLPKLHALDYHELDGRYAEGLRKRMMKKWEEQE